MVEQISSLRTGVKYKDTPLGKIPVDWDITSISRICKIRRGASPRPIRDPAFFSKTGRGWIRISDVTSTYKHLKKTSQYLSEKGISRSVKVNPGDLIMSICATIGKPVIIDIEACIHDGFVLFSHLSKQVDTDFLFYFLQKTEEKFAVQGQIGTQGNLNTDIVRRTLLPFPPLNEQKKIAEILTTVDKAIEKTTQIIERTKELKKGLMQELFTEGIGHMHFKKTKIGKMPTEWKVLQLMEIVSANKPITYGIVQAGPHEPKGVPYIRSGDLNNSRIPVDNLLRTSEEIAQRYERSEVAPGDIVFSLRGNIGATRVVPPKLTRANLTQGTARITCRSGIHNYYVNLALQSPNVRKRIGAVAKGSTFTEISLEELRKLPIPTPKLSEQKRIAEILSSVDNKIEKESTHKEHLELLKKGLMQVLLTGKLRVTV